MAAPRLAGFAGWLLAACALASEPGSGIYAPDCADMGQGYRVSIRADGAADVQRGEIVYMDLLTSYSYFGVGTPEDFLVAVLFEPEGGPVEGSDDGGPRIEIWTGEAEPYALINGNAEQRLSYCGELGTPGADAEMPFSADDYDALGYLTCQPVGAGLPRACPFGLTIGEAGSVALTVQTPFARERRLELVADGFRDASGEPVSATREARTWRVTVGNEYYEIPAGALGGD